MKLAGCIIIVLAFSLMGFMKAISLKKRCTNISAVKGVLKILETEISFSRSCLSSALKNAAAGSPVEILFFECADEINTSGIDSAWRSSLLRNAGTLSLENEDCEFLGQLSKELGKTDVKNQIRHIRYVSELIDIAYSRAEDEYNRKFSLYKNAGIAIGVFAALMLM